MFLMLNFSKKHVHKNTYKSILKKKIPSLKLKSIHKFKL